MSAPGGEALLPVAAVVVNYNAGDSLLDCVKSLLAERVAEVVVVDNASSDGSADSVASAGARLVENGRNIGYGGAANVGARLTTSEYLVVCNPDLVVAPGAVATLVDRLASDPSLGVVGPMLRDPDGAVYPSGRDFPSLKDAVGHAFLGLVWGGNPWTRRYRHLGSDQHRPRRADWVSGSFLAARRLAFSSVGGFDESYFMYVEDVDLCWRLSRAGWATWYEPAAEVCHEQGRSASRRPYRMLVAHHRSMWRFARRSARGVDRLLLPVMGVGLVVRLLLAFGEHATRPGRERVLGRAPLRSGRDQGGGYS